MSSQIKELPLAEIDEKNKMMVVRVSIDLYDLLQQEAESLEITVSAMVRSLLSFNYYPDLLDRALGEAQHDIADKVEQAQYLDCALAEYEARLSRLSANLDHFALVLAGQQERISRTKKEIHDSLRALVRGLDTA